MHHSQIVLIRGSSFASSSSWVLNSVCFYFSIASLIPEAIPGAKFFRKSRMPVIICLEKATIMNTTCIETLLTAFPSKHGKKNVMNGSWKCPHINPAKSNKGFGIYYIQQMINITCKDQYTEKSKKWTHGQRYSVKSIRRWHKDGQKCCTDNNIDHITLPLTEAMRSTVMNA